MTPHTRQPGERVMVASCSMQGGRWSPGVVIGRHWSPGVVPFSVGHPRAKAQGARREAARGVAVFSASVYGHMSEQGAPGSGC
jgi:hypothetical protein